MLIDDGAIACWLPDSLADCSSCRFLLPGGDGLTSDAIALPADMLPAAFLTAECESARTRMCAVLPTVAVVSDVRPILVSGAQAAVSELSATSEGANLFRGVILVRTERDAATRLTLEAQSEKSLDLGRLRTELLQIERSVHLLQALDIPPAPRGWTLRLLGRIGLALPAQAVADGRYLARSREDPPVLFAVWRARPPDEIQVGYWDRFDELEIIEDGTAPAPIPPSPALSLAAEASGVVRTVDCRRVRRRRAERRIGNRVLSRAIDDEHELRRYTLASPPTSPGMSPLLHVFGAAPRSRVDELASFWERVIASCRLEGGA